MSTITDALEKLSAKLGGSGADSETIVDALKQIYAAYGGTGDLSEADTIAEMIDEITTVATQGGGGGSSDFTTAQVTLTDTRGSNSSGVSISGVFVGGNEFIPSIDAIQETITGTVVLYKGLQQVSSTGMESLTSISGNITGNLDDGFVITGDCTIVGVGEELLFGPGTGRNF